MSFGGDDNCSAPSGFGQLVHQVTEALPGQLQEARSAAGKYHGMHQAPGAPDHYMGLIDSQIGFRDADVERLAFGDSREADFPVADMVSEFEHFSMAHPPVIFQGDLNIPREWAAEFQRGPVMPQMSQHRVFEDVYREQEIALGAEGWAEQFHFQNEIQAGNNWADEFQDSSSQRGGGIDQDALNKLINSENPKFRNSKFVKFLSQINSGEIELDVQNNTIRQVEKPSVADEWAEQYSDLHSPGLTTADAGLDVEEKWAGEFNDDVASWVKEFQQGNQEFFDQDQWADEFDNIDWKDYSNSLHETKFEDAYEESSAYNRSGRDYVFSSNNPFSNIENPKEIGMQLMTEGNLSDAILAFESSVQRFPDDAESWRYLGQCNQENEDESQAISALTKAVDLDHYNLDALLMLGVSHTNDLEQGSALRYLRSWLENHPDYHFENSSTDIRNPSSDLFLSVDQVLRMFNEAASQCPEDVEILTALGVLYNISNDYTQATQIFQRCVQLRPNDASLWNKLGATQANGSMSVEAISAYSQALQLKPNYVRALANLGISFANQGMHDKAVQAYLATLSKNPNADHVWNYLRISLSSMNRPELVELTTLRDVGVFKEYFQF